MSIFIVCRQHHIAKLVAAASIHPQLLVVVLPERGPMRDGDECDANLLAVLVHEAFDVDRDGRGALVEDGELRLVVKDARHGDALLLAAAEHIEPVLDRVPSALLDEQRLQLHVGQQLPQLLVAPSFGHRLRVRVWVRELVAEAAAAQVRLLRNIKQRVRRRIQRAIPQRPQLAQHAEQRRLATAIGAHNHQVLARRDAKRNLVHEDIAIRRHHRHALKLDRVARHMVHAAIGLDASRAHLLAAQHHLALIVASLQVVQHTRHIAHHLRVAREALNVLVRHHNAPDRLAQIDQQRAVADVVLRDVGRLSHRAQVLVFAGAEHGQSQHRIAAHDTAIFLQEAVECLHAKLLPQHILAMARQLGILRVENALLACVSAIKRNLFRVRNQAMMATAEIALQIL
mmetsp:Transcript_43663/g.72107  ORF Transcript_43663/g.72107 Transcript_43663/m.72107 type:complete len:400 (-) Transcript_43663:345-1544(-)